MTGLRRVDYGAGSSHRQEQRDPDGAIAAQRWAFAIAAAFALVGLIHALW
jgi:hypothetical protein